MPLRSPRSAQHLALAAALAIPVLLLHRSEAAAVLGRYSLDYAVLLALYALNVALLWGRTLPALSRPSSAPTSSAAPLLVLATAVFAGAALLDHVTGSTSIMPSYRALIALGCGVAIQLDPDFELWNRLGALHPAPAALVLLLGGALVLRGIGIGFGLPFLYEPDEHIFVKAAAGVIANGDPNPHWFGHPGTTTIYLLALLYAVLFRLAPSAGLAAGPGDFESFFAANQTAIYLSGRWMMAACGVATILLTFLIARRLFGRATAVMAAAILALSPLHIWYSRVIRTDILASVLILVVVWLCLDILERRRVRSYALAGFLTGIGAATKYPAIIVALTAVVAHVLSRPRRWRHAAKLLVAGGGVAAGIFLSSPYLLLDHETAIRDLASEAAPARLSGRGAGFIGNLQWYVQNTLPEALTGAGLVLALAGAALCLASRRRERWLLITFPIFFLTFVSSLHLRWARWSIPAIPFLAILAAHAAREIAAWAGRGWNQRLAVWTQAAILLAIAVPLLSASLRQGLGLRRPDTRTIARDWIVANVPGGSRILLEASTPQLPAGLYRTFLVGWEGEVTEAREPKENGLPILPSGHVGRLGDLEALDQAEIEYIVLGTTCGRYRTEFGREEAQAVAICDAVTSRATQIWEIQPAPGRIQGPPLRVLRFEPGRAPAAPDRVSMSLSNEISPAR